MNMYYDTTAFPSKVLIKLVLHWKHRKYALDRMRSLRMLANKHHFKSTENDLGLTLGYVQMISLRPFLWRHIF